MSTINQLSTLRTPQNGDLIAVYSSNNGDARKSSLSTLYTYFSDISKLPSGGGVVLEDADSFAVLDNSASATVQTTVPSIRNYVQSGIFTGLTAGATIADDDLFFAYDTSGTSTVSYTGTNLKTYLSASFVDEYVTQEASPAVTGFNVQINDDSSSTHLILTPDDGYAAGTITLPLSTNLVNKQEVIVNCTKQITVLTLAGNGATIVGAPQSLGADGFFRLKYNSSNTTWYRIG